MSPIGSLAALNSVSDVLFYVLGVALVVGTASSVVRTLIVTRGINSIIARVLAATPRMVVRTISRQFSSYIRRDSILSWTAPLSILTMLLGWLVLFWLGYTCIVFAASELSFWTAARQSGSSLFTLGFAASGQGELTFVDFVAAATGPIVIGLMIGYLPTLYSAYNRRELSVALLRARAGEPNWGPELLARHSKIGSTQTLEDLWASWEQWAADVSESHATYPILIYTRSSHAYRNWVVALLSVMDSAALSLSLHPVPKQAPPRMLIRQGVDCLRVLCDAARLPYDPNPTSDTQIELTPDAFAEAVAVLDASGFERSRTAEQAWPYFREWRIVYEPLAYALAKGIDAVPALWSGPRIPAMDPIPPWKAHYIVDNPDGSIQLAVDNEPQGDPKAM